MELWRTTVGLWRTSVGLWRDQPILNSVQLQYRHEGGLGNFHISDLAHATFFPFLFFQEFAFAGDVTAVTFWRDVLAYGFDGFTGDDFGANSGLDGYVKLLAWYEFFKFSHFRPKV